MSETITRIPSASGALKRGPALRMPVKRNGAGDRVSGGASCATLFVEQAESPQGYAGRHVHQIGITGTKRINAANATHHRNVLLAVPLPAYRLPDDAGGRLEAP